jgi:hypothetical protein
MAGDCTELHIPTADTGVQTNHESDTAAHPYHKDAQLRPIHVLSAGPSDCHRLTPWVFSAAFGPKACGKQSFKKMDIVHVLWHDLPVWRLTRVVLLHRFVLTDFVLRTLVIGHALGTFRYNCSDAKQNVRSACLLLLQYILFLSSETAGETG